MREDLKATATRPAAAGARTAGKAGRRPGGGRGEPAWLSALRARARERFEGLGWPTPAEEEWRRTDLAGLGLDRFTAAGPARGGGAAVRLRAPAGSGGARLLPLAEAALEAPEAVRELLEAGLEGSANRLQAWLFAGWTHGAFLDVPAGVEIAEPFVVETVEAAPGAAPGVPTAPGALTASLPLLLVRIGRAARAAVVWTVRGGGEQTLCNSGAVLHLGDGGGLRLFSLQDLDERALYFSHRAARLGRDASLLHFEGVFGGRLARTCTDCSLEGSGAEARLHGAWFARGDQHLDLRTVQRHRRPAAASRALYKGAVQDGGWSIYQGLIDVSPGASKTDAYLANRNLVLSEGARADSIPSLKIENNDLRCSHGSTTGRIPQEELFYLQARGLAPEEAREMLVQAWFEEVFREVPEELAAALRERVRERVTGGARGSAPPSAAMPSAAIGTAGGGEGR